jgi:TATA-binding protein-associated factor Taf7
MLEEVFVLRAPPVLADRLRRILAEDSQAAADLELQFGEDGRTGTLRVGSDVYPAKLQDLPTKVETWKTLDDVNLVKAADVGQIIVVSPPGEALPTDDVSVDGVTLAMRCVCEARKHMALVSNSRLSHRDAKRTHFRKPLEFDKDKITATETELAKLIAGGSLVKAGETEVHLTEEWV